MDDKALQLLEGFCHAIITLLAQVVRTFRDMLLFPISFASHLSSGDADPKRYVGPYTFLGVTGFFGTKAILLGIAATFVAGNDFMFRPGDTLERPDLLLTQLIAIPSVKELFTTAVPMVIIIYFLGALLDRVYSRKQGTALAQSIYYIAGLQYLVIAIIAILRERYVGPEVASGDFPLTLTSKLLTYAELLGVFMLPVTLVILVGTKAVALQNRRGGKGFVLFLSLGAMVTVLMTRILPTLVGPLLMDNVPFSMDKLAITRVAVVGSPVVINDSIGANLLVTNQTKNELLLSTDSAEFTIPGKMDPSAIVAPRAWTGRLVDTDARAHFVIIRPSETKVLHFEGSNGRDVSLPNGSNGRLEFQRVMEDGSITEVIAYSHPRADPAQPEEED